MAGFSSKTGIPVCLQGFLKIAFCQSLQLPPAPSEVNKTRRAQQLPQDSGPFRVWARELNKIYCLHPHDLSGLELYEKVICFLFNILIRWIYIVNTQDGPRGMFTCWITLYIAYSMLQNLVCGSLPSIRSNLSHHSLFSAFLTEAASPKVCQNSFFFQKRLLES